MSAPPSRPPPSSSALGGPEAVAEAVTHLEGGAEEVIPLVEEEVHLDKRQVTTGRVQIRTLVDAVQETVRASVAEETVEVTRVPVGREIDQAPEVRTEDGVTIMPVLEEVLVVGKRLVLKEELHIRRTTRSEDVDIPIELRRQRVEVERLPGSGTSESSE